MRGTLGRRAGVGVLDPAYLAQQLGTESIGKSPRGTLKQQEEGEKEAAAEEPVKKYGPSTGLHYFPYLYKAGYILIDKPDGHPDDSLSRMFACPKEPDTIEGLLAFLRKQGMCAISRDGFERSMGGANEDYVSVGYMGNMMQLAFPERRRLCMVTVEKNVCPSGVMEWASDSDMEPATFCGVCRNVFGLGARCSMCKDNRCKKCAPHEYESHPEKPDSAFVVRLITRPRCERCLPIMPLQTLTPARK